MMVVGCPIAKAIMKPVVRSIKIVTVCVGAGIAVHKVKKSNVLPQELDSGMIWDFANILEDVGEAFMEAGEKFMEASADIIFGR